jgi:hypothetical protein
MTRQPARPPVDRTDDRLVQGRRRPSANPLPGQTTHLGRRPAHGHRVEPAADDTADLSPRPARTPATTPWCRAGHPKPHANTLPYGAASTTARSISGLLGPVRWLWPVLGNNRWKLLDAFKVLLLWILRLFSGVIQVDRKQLSGQNAGRG